MACVDAAPTLPGVAPGDLVVWAAEDADGARFGAFTFGGQRAAVALSADAVIWRVAGAALRRGDGGAVDSSWLSSVQAVPASDAGGCGRCTGARHGSEAVVFPGDRCALPSSAVLVRGEANRVARLAKTFTLAYPGECRCPRGLPEFDPAPPPALVRISPRARLSAQVLATGASQDIVGLSHQGAWRYQPGLPLIEREPPPESCAEPSPLGLLGELRSAEILPDGGVVAVEQAPRESSLARYRLHLFSPTLEPAAVFDFGWVITTVRLVELSGEPKLLLAGYQPSIRGDRPWLESCELPRADMAPGTELSCEPAPLPAEVQEGKSVRTIEGFGSQLLFLIEAPVAGPEQRRHLMLAAEPRLPWRFIPVAGPTAAVGADSELIATLATAQQLLVHGRRLSLCSGASFAVEPGFERDYAFVFEAELPDRIEGPEVRPEWRLRRELPHDCPPLIPGPDGHARTVLVEDPGPRVVPIDRERAEPAAPLGALAAFRYDARNDRSIAVGRDGAVQVWSDTLTRPESYATVVPAGGDPSTSFCPLARRGSLYAFGSDGTLVELREPTERAPQVSALPELVGVSACAYETSTDRFLLAGRGPEGPFARWFDPEGRRFEDVVLPTLGASARFIDAAGTGWGAVILLGSNDEVLEASGAEAALRPIDWDDPSTELREQEIETDCCNFQLRGGRRLRIPLNGPERPHRWLHDVDAADGAVWLAGRGGALFRAFPGRVERVAYEGALLDPSSLRAVCGDVVIAGQQGLGRDRERGELRWLTRSEGGPLEVAGTLSGGVYTARDSGSPTALFGTSARLLTALGRSSQAWGSLQTQGGRERRALPSPVHGAAATEDGHVLLSTGGGQLYLGVDCRY